MLYFILGIIFIVVILPFLQGFIDLFTTWVNCKTSVWALELQQYSNEINGVQEQEYNTQCIGFQAPEQEEYYDDDFE